MKSLGGHYLSEEDIQAAGFKRVGKNVKIHSRASLYGLENMEIGDHVRIDDFTVIIATGRFVIGSYISIPNFCFLGAKNGITIGNFVTFAPGVKIFSASDDYEGNWLTGVAVPPEMTGGKHAPVEIEDYVIIGCGSMVLPGCRIAEGSAIGALSMVKEGTSPWGVYSGIPAIRRKERKKELIKYAEQLCNLERV